MTTARSPTRSDSRAASGTCTLSEPNDDGGSTETVLNARVAWELADALRLAALSLDPSLGAGS
jgi:hypothetical protein